jgi:hypothetical protein
MKQRTTRARKADARQMSKIATARSIIYDKGYAVNSRAVDTILKDESWVGNSVSRNKIGHSD